MIRQQRLQQRPLRITEIMSIQPAIIHSEIQAETTLKIYGTRPKPVTLSITVPAVNLAVPSDPWLLGACISCELSFGAA
jgi:hypothetical protein